MTFGAYDSALKMRDLIKRIAASVVSDLRPEDKFGRVVDLDRSSGVAFVVYSGAENSPIRVKLLPGVQPQKYDRISGTGSGAIVRVSGALASRYIAEIVSESPTMMQPRFSSPAVTGGLGDDHIACLTFSFDMSGVVLPADATTKWWTVIMNYPLETAYVQIYTQATMSDGSTWMMVENHLMDSASGPGVLTVNLEAQSSTGVDVRTNAVVYDGSIDSEPSGTAGVTYWLERAVTSTRAISTLRVVMRAYATDVKLVKITDGLNASV